MWTTSWRLGGCLILLMASLSLAQDTPDPKKPPRPDQREGLEDARAREGARGATKHLIKRLKKDVALDEQQVKAVEKILNAYDEETRELHKSLRHSPEAMERLGKIREEMRQARENDDTATVDRLRAEMKELRNERRERLAPFREKIEKLRADTHDKMKAEMREDQKEKFEAVWGQIMEPHHRRSRPGREPGDLRVMIRRLDDLTDEQRTRIDEVYEAYRKQARETRDDPEAAKQAVDKLFTDVLSLLTPEQRETVEKKLKAHERRGEDRRDRRERRGPRGGGHRADKAEEGASSRR